MALFFILTAMKHLSLEEVSSQAFLAFTSGFPTILSTMNFFMFEVAKNQSIQNKLSVEIEDMFERSEGSPVYSDIAQMKYLDACLNGNCIICSLYARCIFTFCIFHN